MDWVKSVRYGKVRRQRQYVGDWALPPSTTTRGSSVRLCVGEYVDTQWAEYIHNLFTNTVYTNREKT